MALTIVCILNILICFGIPLGALVYLLVKKRSVVPYLLGVATFLVSQLLLRLPLLQVLGRQEWFYKFSLLTPILFTVIISLSAGLFEEGGRYIAMRLGMKNKLTTADAIAFGFGHGGLEAAALVGIQYVTLLFTPGLLEQAAALPGLTVGLALMAGIERLSAMLFHIAASVVVMLGVRDKKPLYLLLAIGMHTLFNSLIILYSLGIVGAYGIEVVLGIAALLAALLAWWLVKRATTAKAKAGIE